MWLPENKEKRKNMKKILSKSIKIISLLFLIFLTSSKIFAVTNYVSKSGGHVSPFTSWANAATNIQSAVDVAIPNDIVLVTNGTYYPSDQIFVRNDIIVKSFNGAEKTIVDGSYANRCFYLNDANPTIDGFTITNGYSSKGGGVFCDDSGIIQNCIISGNSVITDGGGTYNGIVNNCMINGNSAGNYGGGTFYSIVNNSLINGNSAGSAGGGIRSGIVNNSIISGNLAKNWGGGTSYGTVNNCTISGNSAGNSSIGGGGGTVYSTINNCIIWDNSASAYPNFYSGTIGYSCTYPLPPGVGNFTNNPILLSASHIAPNSPCLGSGANAYATGADIDNENWKNPPSVGCDEVYTNDLTGDLLVDIYAEYTSAVVGTALEFRAIITGKPVSNYWSFGDGVSAVNNYITEHSFDIAGEYQVILSAFNIDNPAGVSATVTVNIVELNNATYYVSKSNTTPVYPYKSWSTAALNIQDAIDVAEHIKFSFVFVTNGIYDIGEKVTPGYSCSNRVVITKHITVKSVNGPENTIILGKGPLGSNAVRCAYMSTGVLDGFTVSNGFTMTSGRDYYDQAGGGVNMYSGYGAISNCIIGGNSARLGGGTFFGSVNNCTIIGNSAKFDAGGSFYGTVNNCTIIWNSAGHYGGGAYRSTINNSAIIGNSACCGGGVFLGTVNNCTIIENSAYSGGGTYNGTVNNCTINGNSAEYGGGGTFYGTVNNCTIIGNSAEYGGGSYRGGFNNCIVWDNSASISNNYYRSTVRYSCTYPLPSGAGNISNNPQFISISDFHLQATSPCRNAGTNAFAPMPWDLDGNPRIIGRTVDMGCYEFVPEGGIMLLALSATLWLFRNRHH